MGGSHRKTYICNGLYPEEHLSKALHNYLMFAETHLQLPLPLKIEAGLTGIKDYPIAVDNVGFHGKSLRDVIQWKQEIPAYGKPSWEILSAHSLIRFVLPAAFLVNSSTSSRTCQKIYWSRFHRFCV